MSDKNTSNNNQTFIYTAHGGRRLTSLSESLISASSHNPEADNSAKSLARLRVVVAVLGLVTTLTAATCIACLVVLATGQIRAHGARAEGEQGSGGAELCVPCRDLRLSTPEENAWLATLRRPDGTKRPVGNANRLIDDAGKPQKDDSIDANRQHDDAGEDAIESCCATTREQQATVISRFVERRVRLAKAKGTLCGAAPSYRNRRIYAHLMGMRQTDNAQHDEPALKWIHKKGMARTENIEYDNGYLVIPTPGLYFVYSQLYLTEYPDTETSSRTAEVNNSASTSTESRSQSKRIKHKVVRTNILYGNRAEEVILQNVQSHVWARRGGFLETTSFVGAAVYLRREDRIAVKVSHLSLIHHYPKSTYFGVVLLH